MDLPTYAALYLPPLPASPAATLSPSDEAEILRRLEGDFNDLFRKCQPAKDAGGENDGRKATREEHRS